MPVRRRLRLSESSGIIAGILGMGLGLDFGIGILSLGIPFGIAFALRIFANSIFSILGLNLGIKDFGPFGLKLGSLGNINLAI